MRNLFLVAMLCLGGYAHAGDSFKEYRWTVDSAVHDCSVEGSLQLISGDNLGKIVQCIQGGRERIKGAFQPLRDSLPEGAAKEALKNYQVKALAALSATLPSGAENEGLYDRRTRAARAEADAAWERFEVER